MPAGLTMSEAVTRFDHAMIAVSNLERAAQSYRALGFRVTPRGEHAGRGTANHCIMFPETYIELIGITDPGYTGNLRGILETQGEGAMGLAWGDDDPDAVYARLTQAGLKAAPPAELSRPLSLDGEEEVVRFKTVNLAETGLEPIIQFVCSHLTPHLTRARHEWQLHANGAMGINEIIAVSDAPDAHEAALSKLFGRKAVRARAGDVTALVDPMTFRITTLAGLAARFPKAPIDRTHLGGNRIAAVCLDVTEPDAATTMWDMAGVAYAGGPGGAVYLAPSVTHGVILEFSEG